MSGACLARVWTWVWQRSPAGVGLMQVPLRGPCGRAGSTAADLNDADGRVLERGLQRMNLNHRACRVGRRLGEQRHAEAGRDELADAAGAVGLERDAGREARGGGRRDEQYVQAAAARQADER